MTTKRENLTAHYDGSIEDEVSGRELFVRLDSIMKGEAREASAVPPLDRDVWRRFAAALLYAQQHDQYSVSVSVETASAVEAALRAALPQDQPQE